MVNLKDFTPGEVIEVNQKWGGTTIGRPAVFVGVDRGLAVVGMVDGTGNPFWVDPVTGEQPMLTRARWQPKRVRATTIVGTWIERQNRLAAEANAEAARRKAEADARVVAELNARRVVRTLDLLGVTAYTQRDRVEVAPRDMAKLAEILKACYTEGAGEGTPTARRH